MQVRQWCWENVLLLQRRVYEATKAVIESVFVEVVTRDEHSKGIAVVIRSGSVRVEIMNGLDAATVRSFLSVIMTC